MRRRFGLSVFVLSLKVYYQIYFEKLQAHFCWNPRVLMFRWISISYIRMKYLPMYDFIGFPAKNNNNMFAEQKFLPTFTKFHEMSLHYAVTLIARLRLDAYSFVQLFYAFNRLFLHQLNVFLSVYLFACKVAVSDPACLGIVSMRQNKR